MNIQELTQLAELKEDGLLSEEEFNRLKENFFHPPHSPSNEPFKKNWNNYLADALRNPRFHGRSSHLECATLYGFWVCMNLIIVMLPDAHILDSGKAGVLAFLFNSLIVLQLIAVSVRRLHDFNISGKWLLILFGVWITGLSIPFLLESWLGPNIIVSISKFCLIWYSGSVLLYLALGTGDKEENDFGPVPDEFIH